jgi:hypothetical protein
MIRLASLRRAGTADGARAYPPYGAFFLFKRLKAQHNFFFSKKKLLP